MKIIFCDTNIIYGLSMRLATGQEITSSSLFELAKKHSVYVSTFVLNEMVVKICQRQKISYSVQELAQSLFNHNVLIRSSDRIHDDIVDVVYDIDDRQILQDALDVHANYLITNNIVDFDLERIHSIYGLVITPEIPQELF